MRDQFYMNNYELHCATKIAIGVTASLGFNFRGTLAVKKKKEYLVNDVCMSQTDWIVSLTRESFDFYLGFLHQVLLQYLWSYGFNYTLYIFRCAFHLHFST